MCFKFQKTQSETFTNLDLQNMAATLAFQEIKTISISKGKPFEIGTDSRTVWKIESAGIGGTSGSLLLVNADLPAGQQEIAILYSAVEDKVFGSPLPYWIQANFKGRFLNDSSYTASVSITVYSVA